MEASLKEKLNNDLKQALRNGDKVKLGTIRMVLSAAKNAEIAKQSELNDSDMLDVLAKEIEQHRESIVLYKKYNRPDLVAAEEAELTVLLTYAPKQFSHEEVAPKVEHGKVENTTSEDVWVFSCPHCGKEYRIGIDAGIMTIEEAIEMLRSGGATISGSLGPSWREDMLCSFDGVAPERLSLLQQEAKRTVKTIKEALAKGQERAWYCQRCGSKKGTYPY